MPVHPEISVVVPLYNEEINIEALYSALIDSLTSLNREYEIVFVDDGSRDRSFELVKMLNSRDERVKGIALSRNFGHQVALTAGMQQARGSIIVTMDADLQHPPEIIPLLVDEYSKGFDIVNTRRIDSRDTGYFKRTTSRCFYRFINRVADVSIPESSSDFRLMSRKALDSFLQFGERDRFTRGLVSWMGFRQTVVNYDSAPRFAGKSKYSLRRMLHFALDGITSFSAKPLRIASYMGILTFVLGIAYAIFAIVQHMTGKTVPGWTSLLVTILLLGGIQLLSLGIIGEYLARIFNESKSRPLYFIKDRID
jgi:polyisoprenyl-phosphate glycosyltransferase